MAEKPIVQKLFVAQTINEGAALGPFNLNDYIQSDPESGTVRFQAELANGMPLPAGLICTSDGILSGIAAKGTIGNYEVIISAQNEALSPLIIPFTLTILDRHIEEEGNRYFSNLKSQVWLALGKNLPIPEVADLFNRPLTVSEVYYLLQRFATLTIWDVYNLDPPSEKKLLSLEGMNPHYHFYDRGSCLVAVPKDLFSHERTLFDALQASRILAREAFDRSWTIEFAGFDKMCRAAWIEIQLLTDKYGKSIEILHYHPSISDFKLYEAEARALNISPGASA